MRYFCAFLLPILLTLQITGVSASEQLKEVKVKQGDTLYRMAKKYQTSVNELVQLNKIANPRFLRVGQTIRIPIAIQHQQLESSTLPIISRGHYLGHFTLTAYTAGEESTGKEAGDPDYGVTASGEKVIDGLTIAVDPQVIPIGSRVYIAGIGYRIAQDTGSAIKGKRIDLFMSDLQKARHFGVHKNVRVELIH